MIQDERMRDDENDRHFMTQALTLAASAAALGEVPVGCILVDAAGNVVATGENRRERTFDPTAHAEVVAVRAASDGYGADVVLEMSGVASAVHQAFALARPGGRVNMLGIPSRTIDIDFASEIIFKGLTVYGVVGRRMYETWHQMTRFLRSGAFDPSPVITHRLPLEAVDEAMHLIKSGEAGKIIFQL